MLHGNIMDQFLDQNGFSNAGAAKQADLSALRVRFQQIDDLDAGLQDLHRRSLIFKTRSFPVDLPTLRICFDRLQSVNRGPRHVKHPAKSPAADGNANAPAFRDDLHASSQALAGRQHNAADPLTVYVGKDLHHPFFSIHQNTQSFPDLWKRAFLKNNINDRS